MWNQVSKILLAEYMAAQKKKQPFKGLGLEHMNGPCPVLPGQLTRSDLRSSQFQVMYFIFLCCTVYKLCPTRFWYFPSVSDCDIMLERARFTEPICCWSFSVPSTGRKQGVCRHPGKIFSYSDLFPWYCKYALILVSVSVTALTFLFHVPELPACWRFG